MAVKSAKLLVALLSCLSATPAFAEIGSAQGTVQGMWTYGNGMVLVGGFNFPGATCGNNGGFYIDPSHPHFSRLLATILTAKASGTTLSVVAKIDNCWYPHITNDPTTYIYAAPN